MVNSNGSLDYFVSNRTRVPDTTYGTPVTTKASVSCIRDITHLVAKEGTIEITATFGNGYEDKTESAQITPESPADVQRVLALARKVGIVPTLIRLSTQGSDVAGAKSQDPQQGGGGEEEDDYESDYDGGLDINMDMLGQTSEAEASPTPSDWQEVTDEDGYTYYWNQRTHETQFEKPLLLFKDEDYDRFVLNNDTGHRPLGESEEAGKGETTVLLADVTTLAQEAGGKIMEIYNAVDFEERGQNGDSSPTAAASLAAKRIIYEGLQRLYPSIPILSPDDELKTPDERKHWKFLWCVGPLDGEEEFLQRNGQFTINIGLCQDKIPIAGVVFCPALDPPLLYKGYCGSGAPAFKARADPLFSSSASVSSSSSSGLGLRAFKGKTDPSSKSSPFAAISPQAFDPEVDEGLKIVASQSDDSPEMRDFIEGFKNAECVSAESSLKLLMVADGRAHIYPRLGPTFEWATCAAHAIVKCGGGTVAAVKGGAPCNAGSELEYNKEDQKNPYFVVMGKQISRDLGDLAPAGMEQQTAEQASIADQQAQVNQASTKPEPGSLEAVSGPHSETQTGEDHESTEGASALD